MLYRFNIELSDIDRGIYETLDFRLAQHPSETLTYLLTRTLAFALSYQQGLEFSPEGLHDPEVPALRAIGNHSNIDLWIEIGNPSFRKLHKASKAAKQVVVYTYKSPEVLLEEIRANRVHQAESIQIFSLDPKFLEKLEEKLEKNNRWSVLVQQGSLDVNTGTESFSTEMKLWKL